MVLVGRARLTLNICFSLAKPLILKFFPLRTLRPPRELHSPPNSQVEPNMVDSSPEYTQ